MVFTILIDRREKLPWRFTNILIENVSLECGDYSVKELEPRVLTIERKGNIDQIYKQLVYKRGDLIENLAKMSVYKYKSLICDFPMKDLLLFPSKSQIAARKLIPRYDGQVLYTDLRALCEQFGVTLHFCHNKQKARNLAFCLMKGVVA